MVDFEFCYVAGGRWYRTAVSVTEYSTMMNSGMFDGKILHAVRLWYHDEDHLVYNFTLAKQGKHPFEVEVAEEAA